MSADAQLDFPVRISSVQQSNAVLAACLQCCFLAAMQVRDINLAKPQIQLLLLRRSTPARCYMGGIHIHTQLIAQLLHMPCTTSLIVLPDSFT